MQFDLTHSAAAAILIFLTVLIMKKPGLSKQQEKGGACLGLEIFLCDIFCIARFQYHLALRLSHANRVQSEPPRFLT